MKGGVIILSRDRAHDILPQTLPFWVEQDVPILILTERKQVFDYDLEVRHLGLGRNVRIYHHQRSNRGVGYARASSVLLANRLGWDAFIQADDDTRPTGGDVRPLLEFVAAGRGGVCGGWMPPYGLWYPNGNELAKEPGLCLATGAPKDKAMAISVRIALLAGNFEPRLTVYHDTSEIGRRIVRAGHMWYVSTSLHIKSVNKPKDPGGITGFAGGVDQRATLEQRCHEIAYELWPKYVSHPSKRFACKWRLMFGDWIGEAAYRAVKEAWVFEMKDVVMATEFFR